jgi:hypothetical protein
MASRAGAGEWILRLLALVLVAGGVWYAYTHVSFGNAETEDQPILYDHDGYEGRPDRPLGGEQVDALEQRARSQGF